jgi:hypothetical protein
MRIDQRFGFAFSIGHAAGQVGERNQIAPTIRLGQRLDYMRIGLEWIRRLDVRNPDFTHDWSSLSLSTSATK